MLSPVLLALALGSLSPRPASAAADLVAQVSPTLPRNSAPALKSATSAQTAWTVPGAQLLGFRQDGWPVTRQSDPQSRRLAPSLEVRDPASGRVTSTVLLPEAAAEAYPLAFTPDLGTLAWISGEGTASTAQSTVLTVRTPTQRWTASTPGLRGARELILSPDGGTLAIPNDNGYVQLWDVPSGQRRATILLRARPDQVLFRPDGQELAINERFYDPDASSLVRWSLDGTRRGVVAGVHDVSRGAFAYSADGTKLLLQQRNYAPGWVDLQTGTVQRWQPHITPCPPGSPREWRGCAHTLSVSLDAGRTRALATSNAGVLLYDAGSGRPLQTLDPHLGGGVLSPDGQALYRLVQLSTQTVLKCSPLPQP